MAIRKPIFVMPLPAAGVAASSAAPGHDASNLVDFAAMGLTWKTSASGSCWILGQFSKQQPVDFAALVSANATAATQWRVRLGTTQAQVDGAAPYDSGTLPFISPSIEREDGRYHSHLELPAAVSASWFRIDITGATTAFEASALVLGKRIEPERFYNWDREFGVQDLGGGKFTSWGVFDEEPGLIFRTLDFSLGWTSETEYEGNFRPMHEKLGTRGVVYVAFDPEPGPYRQAKTYMGILKKPGFARGTRRPGFTQDFSILSMI